LAEAIAGSKIDCVEAFTPYESDMTLAEARQAWPGKILWINFPSSVHLADDDVIEETTRRILHEAAPGDRLLVGITENVPMGTWHRSFSAILRVLRQDGRLPLSG
jgi:EAL domain-containing protein (putative c-di-GMP-specific phosphodiesterase class I)